jgi:ferredoxin-nitrite reductase
LGVFSPSDAPATVLATVRSFVTQGRVDELRADPLLVGKLRMVGVYDDRQDRFFMLRIRIPGGLLSWQQAEVIGTLTDRLSVRPAWESPEAPERIIEITTRQDIQVHWIRLEHLEEIWQAFDDVGLTSQQACGDTARNVTGCPVAGVLAGEALDASYLVQHLTEEVLQHPEHGAFLPRKFKTAITGCLEDCILAQINDLAFTPAERDGRLGFSAWVGGGLSDYPRLASRLDLFVPPERVAEVAKATIAVYKANGDYEHKAVNRFRRVVEELGPQAVQQAILDRLDSPLEPAGRELTTEPRFDHVGVHAQRQPGLRFVGLAVPVGRMAATELVELAHLARDFGDGTLRLTARQDAVLPGVPEERVPELLATPLIRRYSPHPKPFTRSVVACTSAPFCKFGIANMKEHGRELASFLDDELADGDATPFRLHLSGCKASCAQIQIADIGLRATMTRDETSFSEAFDVLVGGDPARGRLGEWLELERPMPAVRSGIARLVRAYRAERRDAEAFGEFLARSDWGRLRSFFQEDAE